MTNTEIKDFIANAIEENRVMLFMKGTPHQPACGFSARTAGALNALGVKYAALDILPDPRIREELSGISGWPTIPQLFVDGELVGGADIVAEMYESGELAQVIGVQPPADAPTDAPAAAEPGAPPLQIDNNLVENALRPVALGRKNYLFAGSHEAAQRAAMVYSFFAICQKHQVNPYEWLRHTLENIMSINHKNIRDLYPQNFKSNM